MTNEEIVAKVDADIRDKVSRYGWTVMGVGAGNGQPTFSYSVGLATEHRRVLKIHGRPDLECGELPELVVFGLQPEVAWGFMADLLQKYGSNWPADGHVDAELAQRGYRLALRDVDPDLACSLLMGPCERFHGGIPERVVQIVWPDQANLLPWETGCDARTVAVQSQIKYLGPEGGD